MQPCLPSQARATGNHVSPVMGLEAPSCWTVVLGLGGPGARRKIYSTSVSPPTAPQLPPQPAAPLPCPHAQPCVHLPHHFPAHLPTVIILLAIPTAVVIFGLDLPITPLSSPFPPRWFHHWSKMWTQDSSILVLQLLGQMAILLILSLGSQRWMR